MTLQFDASPYLAAFKNQQQQEQSAPEMYAQGIQGIGQGIQGLAQIPEQQRQDRMQQLLMGMKFSEAGLDPGAAFDYYKNGTLPSSNSLSQSQPQESPGLSQGQGENLMPQMRPGQGLEASAGASDMGPRMPQASPSPSFNPMGPTSITKSPIIDAWNKQRGGQTQLQNQQSIQSQPSGTSGLFQKKTFDVNNVLAQLKNGNASALDNLTDKQMKVLEATPAYSQMKKKEDSRSPEQVQALFPHLDVNSLRTAYPNGIPKDDLAFIQSGLKADVTGGEKANQFNQKEWDKIVKESDPLMATSRSGLGLASKADYNANRALVTLSKPVVTNQEASNVMADIASIYQGGSATEFGMNHQAYNTLYGKAQGLLQTITGNPQDALPDAVKQRLIGVLTDMKQTNKQVIKQQLDHIEKSQPKVIKNFQDEWKGLRQNLEGGIAGGPEKSNQGGLMYQGRPLKDTPANRAWLAQQGGK